MEITSKSKFIKSDYSSFSLNLYKEPFCFNEPVGFEKYNYPIDLKDNFFWENIDPFKDNEKISIIQDTWKFKPIDYQIYSAKYYDIIHYGILEKSKFAFLYKIAIIFWAIIPALFILIILLIQFGYIK